MLILEPFRQRQDKEYWRMQYFSKIISFSYLPLEKIKYRFFLLSYCVYYGV